jgi:hypothetical protein
MNKSSDEETERTGFKFVIDHSEGAEKYGCWEGISTFLLLTKTALDLGLAEQLNKRTQPIWYKSEGSDTEHQTEVGMFDLAIMWLRNHMVNDGVDIFEDYEVQKLTPEKAVCDECKVFVDENNKGHESYCSKKEKEL